MSKKSSLYQKSSLIQSWINKKQTKNLQRSIRELIGTTLGETVSNAVRRGPELFVIFVLPKRKGWLPAYATCAGRHSVWNTAPKFDQLANIDLIKNWIHLKSIFNKGYSNILNVLLIKIFIDRYFFVCWVIVVNFTKAKV